MRDFARTGCVWGALLTLCLGCSPATPGADAGAPSADIGSGTDAAQADVGAAPGVDAGPASTPDAAPAGGDVGPGFALDGGLTAAQYQALLNESSCVQGVRCGQVSAANEAKCVAFYAATLAHLGDLLSEEEGAGRLRVDPAAAAACLAILESGVCYQGEACQAAWVPLVPAGGSCVSSFSCIDGTCDNGGCRTVGQCVAHGAIGEACGLAGCRADAWCDKGTCAAKGDVGTPCSTYLACKAGLSCSTTTGCSVPAGLGEGCGEVACASGLTCSATSRTCVPRGDAWAACENSWDCLDGLMCKGGACAPWSDVGGDCVAAYPSGCASDVFCEPATGLCTDYQGKKGDSCAASADACMGSWAEPSLYCSATTNLCTVPAEEGQPCDPAAGPHPCFDSKCDAATKTCRPYTCP